MLNKNKKRLFELTNEIAKLEPWQWLMNIELIWIEPKGCDEPYFVSIMGYEGACYGISTYIGELGLSDFYMISHEDLSLSNSYIMSDMNCLTCYFANEDELDDETLWQLEESGVVPYQRDRYFYYTSMKRRFFPTDLNDEEIETLVNVYEGLYVALKDWLNDKSVDPDWEMNEVIHAKEEEDGWHLSVCPIPYIERTYDEIKMEDDYIKSISKKERNGAVLAIELVYFNIPVHDDNNRTERPINPLWLIVQDYGTGEYIETSFIDFEENEEEHVIEFLCEYIEENGIPSIIVFHNPYIEAAIQDICEKLEIDLAYDDLEDINEFIEGMFK